MKGKTLAILLLLAAVLGGAWYLLSQNNRAAWSSSTGGAGKVVEFPINDVQRIEIKDAAGDLNLVRKNDVWTVQERADYPASFEEVSNFLRKFWELKTVQELKVGPSQLPRLELMEPGKGDASGTLVQFSGADNKPLAGVLLGKKQMRKSEGGGEEEESPFGGPSAGGTPVGRYVKPVSSEKVSLVSEVLENAESKPERWLSKDFVKMEGLKSIAVQGQDDAHRWSVSRENTTAEWKLADAKPEEKLDGSKANSLGSGLTSPSFKDVLAADAKPEETGLDKPTAVTIESFDGFKYELKIGKEKEESYPMTLNVSANFPKERTAGKDEKPEDKTKLDTEFADKQKKLAEKLADEKKLEGRVFLVSKFTLEPLLKDRASLLVVEKKEPAPEAGGPGGMPMQGLPPGLTPGLPPGHPSVATPPMMPPAPPAAPAPVPEEKPAPAPPKPEEKTAPAPPAPESPREAAPAPPAPEEKPVPAAPAPPMPPPAAAPEPPAPATPPVPPVKEEAAAAPVPAPSAPEKAPAAESAPMPPPPAPEPARESAPAAPTPAPEKAAPEATAPEAPPVPAAPAQ